MHKQRKFGNILFSHLTAQIVRYDNGQNEYTKVAWSLKTGDTKTQVSPK